jgi:hypothetical protein
MSCRTRRTLELLRFVLLGTTRAFCGTIQVDDDDGPVDGAEERRVEVVGRIR